MKVVLASNNPGKLEEFKKIFASSGINITPQENFSVPEAEETGLTFIENAILKARNACKYTSLPSIADDSGLEVDALGGKPGIHSARFAGENATQEKYINKLLSCLKNAPKPKRTARFRCVLVYLQHAEDPSPIIAQGTWEGQILTEPAGWNGFGYDPIFFVPEQNCSAAQLSPEIKNKLSHRSKAINNLLHQLNPHDR
jgi:XTP/dITP diphosphohydrolase